MYESLLSLSLSLQDSEALGEVSFYHSIDSPPCRLSRKRGGREREVNAEGGRAGSRRREERREKDSQKNMMGGGGRYRQRAKTQSS